MAARTASLATIPADGDRHVAEPDRDGGLRFVDRGHDGLDPGILEDGIGHTGRDRFDQVPTLRGHQVVDPLSEQPVIHCLRQVVGRAGSREIQTQLDINQEALTFAFSSASTP